MEIIIELLNKVEKFVRGSSDRVDVRQECSETKSDSSEKPGDVTGPRPTCMTSSVNKVRAAIIWLRPELKLLTKSLGRNVDAAGQSR
jgi:hypothetical protein